MVRLDVSESSEIAFVSDVTARVAITQPTAPRA